MASVEAIEQELLHGVRREVSPPRRDSMSGSSASGKEGEDEEGVDDDSLLDDEDGRPVMNHPSLGAHSGHNTGVKGVRNDARRHEEAQRALRGDQIRDTNERMSRKALGKFRTWKEDEADQKREAEAGVKPGEIVPPQNDLREIRQRRLDSFKSQAASNEARRKKMAGEEDAGGVGGGVGNSFFGHLREVGPDQYANAIDAEDPNVFVVVHIYVKVREKATLYTEAARRTDIVYSLSIPTACSCMRSAHVRPILSSQDAYRHEVCADQSGQHWLWL
jgi:hypothetical protein